MASKRDGKRSSQRKALVRSTPVTSGMERARRSVAAAARSKYAVPAATAMGSTAAIATAIALRRPKNRLVREMARAAVGAGRALVRSLGADAILEFAGLRRRRPLLTAAVPIAAGVTGVLAGSALTLWLATRDGREKPPAASLNSPRPQPEPTEGSDRNWT